MSKLSISYFWELNAENRLKNVPIITIKGYKATEGENLTHYRNVKGNIIRSRWQFADVEKT